MAGFYMKLNTKLKWIKLNAAGRNMSTLCTKVTNVIQEHCLVSVFYLP